MKTRTSQNLIAFTLEVGALLVLVSCIISCAPAPGTHDPGYVAKNWSMTVREFGIVPVFPPREDIQVGDVYGMPLPPDAEVQLRVSRSANGQFLPIPILLASIDLRNELKDFYARRISFPPTPTSQPATQPAPFAQPAVEAGHDVFAGGDGTRPRLGGFPEFFSAQISQGGISGLVPTEAVSIAFGALASANKRVRVSVPMVESYGLPAGYVLRKIAQEGATIQFGGSPTPDDTGHAISSDQLEKLLQPAGGLDTETQALVDRINKEKNAKGYLVVITEIYATRAIDVSIEAETSGAGGLNLQPTTALLKKLPGFSATQPATQTPTSQPATAAQFEVSTPEQIAAATTNQLNEQLAASAPGVTVKFISVTALGVSMRRTYERPIVIGYRGIVYKLDKDSKVVLTGIAEGVAPVNVVNERFQQTIAPEIKKQIVDQLISLFGVEQNPTVEVNGQVLPDKVAKVFVLVTTTTTLNPSSQETVKQRVEEIVRKLVDPGVPVETKFAPPGPH